MRKTRVKAFLMIGAILLGCTARIFAQDANPAPAPLATPVLYKNTHFGFCLHLPADWKGYTVIEQTWSGEVYEEGGDRDKPKVESGPELLIRNLNWSKDDPWQDIPIMIFNAAQWKLVDREELVVSAAPIGPSDIGRNKGYVFALPPRWIGFTDAKGQEELQSLMSQHPLEAPCGHENTGRTENLP
jgi:hypothetical protein